MRGRSRQPTSVPWCGPCSSCTKMGRNGTGPTESFSCDARCRASPDWTDECGRPYVVRLDSSVVLFIALAIFANHVMVPLSPHPGGEGSTPCLHVTST